MALPLKKFAADCEEVALANGNITHRSSPTVTLHDISRKWRKLCRASAFKAPHSIQWSEREETSAELIIATLTYLRRIGCKDIEKLLNETLEQHRRQGL